MALQLSNHMSLTSVLAAKLPQEMIDEVLRFVIMRDSPIDLAHLDSELNALFLPLAGNEALIEVAEAEVWKLNTFRISLTDTEVKQDEKNQTKTLASRTTGAITPNYRKVLHLEIFLADMNLELEGEEVPWDGYASQSKFDKATAHIFSNLDTLFPSLCTVNFKVDNKAKKVTDKLSGAPQVYNVPGAPPTGPGTAFAATSLQTFVNEQMLCMHNCLDVLSAVRIPRLEKVLTFVQDETSLEHKTFDGTLSMSVLPQFCAVDTKACLRAKARDSTYAFLMCSLWRVPKSWLLNEGNTTPVTAADIEKEEREGNSQKRIDQTREMLQWPRAIVKFPCETPSFDRCMCSSCLA